MKGVLETDWESHHGGVRISVQKIRETGTKADAVNCLCSKGRYILGFCYVDDMLIMGKSEENVNELKLKLDLKLPTNGIG